MLARLGLVVLLLAASWPTPAAADWLQEGGDAARTGAVDGELPDWPDVALEVDLEAARPDLLRGAPVIIGRVAYVLAPGDFVPPSEVVTDSYPPSRILRIGLDDGVVQEVASVPWPLTHFASDGRHLVAVGRGRAAIMPLGSGAPAWVDLDGDGPSTDDAATGRADLVAKGQDVCEEPVVGLGVAYFGCLDISQGTAVPYVAAVEIAGAQRLWTKALADGLQDHPGNVAASCLDNAGCLGDFVAVGQETALAEPPRLSLVAGRLYAASNALVRGGNWGGNPLGANAWTLYAIDAVSGAVEAVEGDIETESALPYSTRPFVIPAPTGAEGEVYTKNWYLRRYEGAATFHGERRSVDFRDAYAGDLGSGFALTEDRIFATSLQALHAFDRRLGPADAFPTFQLPPSEAWDAGPLMHAGGMLVGRAAVVDEELQPVESVLYGFDLRSGAMLWRHELRARAQVAVDDGVIVAVTREGKVLILGRTAAALAAVAHSSTQYPTIEADVQVDLSRSGAGLHGPASEFAADWGDGTPVLWQQNASFAHRYAANGDMQARFFVRNAANQTASVPVTFYVGKPDPALTLWNSPLDPRFQNLSFFILGLLATALAGAFGIYRTGRKRRRFHRELRVLESGFESRQAEPRDADTFLAQRRAAARALFLEKKLEEAHASFLERRVDELRRGLRLGTIEEKLGFLPYGMVAHLQRLLADARVDEWERKHFLDALARQPNLSASQRAAARRIIDDWFARDAKVRT